MKKIITFLKNLQFLFRPMFWVMNYPYSKEWDAELNHLLDNYHFTEITEYTAKLNDIKIWITNYPYAAFDKFYEESANKRPSRLTILRANKKLKRDVVRQGGYLTNTEVFLRRLANEIPEIGETMDNRPKKFSFYNKNNMIGETRIKKHKFK